MFGCRQSPHGHAGFITYATWLCTAVPTILLPFSLWKAKTGDGIESSKNHATPYGYILCFHVRRQVSTQVGEIAYRGVRFILHAY